MSVAERIVEVADVQWPFHGNPSMKTSARGSYGSETIDPFPCYAHDRALVEQMLRKVDRVARVKAKPTVYLLQREPLSRTNGWASLQEGCQCDECVADGSSTDRHGTIILAGKRIPLHPAMTRYLVAHEYGHHVEWELLRRRGLKYHETTVEAEYAKMRGLEMGVPYGGGTWHITPSEVLANDFRIVVAGVEEEFWPHACKHPLKVKAVRAWWEENL